MNIFEIPIILGSITSISLFLYTVYLYMSNAHWLDIDNCTDLTIQISAFTVIYTLIYYVAFN